MSILTKEFASKSEMIKNHKECRGKSESFDKIFVLENNQPDAVLFPIAEYNRLSVFIVIQ
jgi:PHD/YefM family antitoxin component YafN of YafNO toxin-antitoxin module